MPKRRLRRKMVLVAAALLVVFLLPGSLKAENVAISCSVVSVLKLTLAGAETVAFGNVSAVGGSGNNGVYYGYVNANVTSANGWTLALTSSGPLTSGAYIIPSSRLTYRLDGGLTQNEFPTVSTVLKSGLTGTPVEGVDTRLDYRLQITVADAPGRTYTTLHTYTATSP